MKVKLEVELFKDEEELKEFVRDELVKAVRAASIESARSIVVNALLEANLEDELYEKAVLAFKLEMEHKMRALGMATF